MTTPLRPDVPDYYFNLNVDRHATIAELKAAFFKLARIHHPDKKSPGEPEDAKEFRQAREAYELLRDANLRAEYDKSYPVIRLHWMEYRAATWAWKEQGPRRQRNQEHEADLKRRRQQSQRNTAAFAAEQEYRARRHEATEQARQTSEEQETEQKRKEREGKAEQRSRRAAEKAQTKQERASKARLQYAAQQEYRARRHKAEERARLEKEAEQETEWKTQYRDQIDELLSRWATREARADLQHDR